jgi:hypothetical protein
VDAPGAPANPANKRPARSWPHRSRTVPALGPRAGNDGLLCAADHFPEEQHHAVLVLVAKSSIERNLGAVNISKDSKVGVKIR